MLGFVEEPVEELSKIKTKDHEEIRKLFPHTHAQPLVRAAAQKKREQKPLRVGVVFSGGPASGGHNVIWGLSDALHPESTLIGFLNGPSGILENKTRPLSRELLKNYHNQGGFDLLGTGRTKIETEEQFSGALKTAQSHKLDGLVIIGGDDSNTNAAYLAEYFLANKCSTKIISVPKTIDGDLQNPYVQISFGFDTAAKVYSELIGNLARDALSTKKYTHFIKLMGRSASHLTLECALATQPNLALISEEYAAQKKTIEDVVHEIKNLILKRQEQGKNYGIILIPEGLFEFLPNLPESIKKEIPVERDPHGNIPLSAIQTEVLIADLVKKALPGKFSPLCHFFGYEGRSAFPSHFDSAYCTALGQGAALLISCGFTGYMAAVTDLSLERWGLVGVPLTSLLHMEERGGKKKAVIQKALVDLKGAPFQTFAKKRAAWALDDAYLYPGPMQFSDQTKPRCISIS